MTTTTSPDGTGGYDNSDWPIAEQFSVAQDDCKVSPRSSSRSVAVVAIPLLAIVAGVLHATSVPATLVFPDAELSPMFACAGITLALWSLLTGLAGASRPVRTSDSVPTAPVLTGTEVTR
jgi:hypothetical protein